MLSTIAGFAKALGGALELEIKPTTDERRKKKSKKRAR